MKNYSCDSRNGFSLIELLFVLSIIGIVYALSHTALNHSVGTARLDTAAESIHAAAKLARQYAVTRNQPVYLVFNEGQTHPELAYRAFAIFTINVHAEHTVSQGSGQFILDWQLFPDGVIIDRFCGGTTNLFSVSGQAAWNGAFSKNNQLLIHNSSYVVHGCKPDGTFGSASHWFFLTEGFYAEDRLIHKSKQGKLVRFSITGESRICDTRYTENGKIKLLSR